MKYSAAFFIILIAVEAFSQVTNIVILNSTETSRLKKIISANHDARKLYDSIAQEAAVALTRQPLPPETIYYEGLLDTDPKRITTVESFGDIDAVASLIYAGYGSDNPAYSKKIRQFITAWANTFKPDGNPINENKLTVLLWGYFLYKNDFDRQAQKVVENWIHQIASGQMNRKSTPNNNWEAKRLRIIGLAGVILKNKQMREYAIDGYKKYIATAYFPDGTSNDLHTRDALHYHISGITPCLEAFINLSRFDGRFNLFDWESEEGSSIRKAVEYTLPYAKGEIIRKEWTNSKVQLDRKRAEAGIEKYRPGMAFDPQDAFGMLEWASYYNPEWSEVYEVRSKPEYTARWVGLLNSPLVRE